MSKGNANGFPAPFSRYNEDDPINIASSYGSLGDRETDCLTNDAMYDSLLFFMCPCVGNSMAIVFHSLVT